MRMALGPDDFRVRNAKSMRLWREKRCRKLSLSVRAFLFPAPQASCGSRDAPKTHGLCVDDAFFSSKAKTLHRKRPLEPFECTFRGACAPKAHRLGKPSLQVVGLQAHAPLERHGDATGDSLAVRRRDRGRQDGRQGNLATWRNGKASWQRGRKASSSKALFGAPAAHLAFLRKKTYYQPKCDKFLTEVLSCSYVFYSAAKLRRTACSRARALSGE